MPNIVALAFGAVIVLFFSYERFNRTTYEEGRQLERLVALLTPDKLRARRVVLQAYLFYAAALLAIYFFLCAYVEVLPLLGGPELAASVIGASQLPATAAEDAAVATTGFTPSANPDVIAWNQPLSRATEGKKSVLDIDATISLSVALVIVGLGPTFPILQRFEGWLRVAAHRLAGIPTRVISAAEDLRRKALQITPPKGVIVPTDTRLIPPGDWERMAHYAAAAKGHLTAPADFHNDLEVVFAVSAWILDRKVKLGKGGERERFDRLEEQLRKRKDVLILELDERSGFRLNNAPASLKAEEEVPATDEGKGAPTSETKRASWDRLARDADELADDFCILLALYAEHEIIEPDLVGAASEPANAQLDPSGQSVTQMVRQQNLAKRKLQEFLGEFLGDHLRPGSTRSYAMVTLFWASGMVLLVTLVWSILPGRFEVELQRGDTGNAYWRALHYALYSFNSYCVPMIVALAIRDGGRQSHRWRNLWRAHWTVKLPQAALVVFASWAVATLFVVGLVLWRAALDFGWAKNELEVWTTLRRSFEYNAPHPLRGAILALIVLFLLDARLAGARPQKDRPSWHSSLLWGGSAGLIMAICGGLTRALSSLAWALGSEPQRSLDSIDRGLILYASVYSGIIGFFVVFCVTEMLINQRPSIPRGNSSEPSSRGQEQSAAVAT